MYYVYIYALYMVYYTQQLHEQHMPGAMAPPESACWAPSPASPDRRRKWMEMVPLGSPL